MFIKAIIKSKIGKNDNRESDVYFRLCESFRTADGKVRQRMVMALGYLNEIPNWEDKKELARCINSLAIKKEYPICDNSVILELANKFYTDLICTGRLAAVKENELALKQEALRLEQEYEKVKLATLINLNAKEIGAEQVCISTLKQLGVIEFFEKQKWSKEDINFALMQIASRAIYPYSEFRTVSYLKENSALSEMLDVEKITKDRLYQMAKSLYAKHTELENWLHNRVCNLFEVEDRILLFDLTNIYFEGRMELCKLAKYGRSKEKRSDCKLVVLAIVVNTEGLLTRTAIYEGNTGDCCTMQEVVKSLTRCPLHDSKQIIVTDAGISTEENIKYLKDNGYNFITVSRSSKMDHYTSLGEGVKTVTDNKGQTIKLEKVKIENSQDSYLLIESQAKQCKESAMFDRSCDLFELGLEAVKKGIISKGGTKKRDKVNERIGRIKERCHSVHQNYNIEISYDDKDFVTDIVWSKKLDREQIESSKHGKYLLRTNLDEKDEKNIWIFYNTIRTVEETIRVMKNDLDIRPIYHKGDDGIKSHLHLAILAYWIVSTVRYQLKKCGINKEWSELVRILSTQKLVSTRVEKYDKSWVEIRQCTEPNEKVVEIYKSLKVPQPPLKPKKFVWHPEAPPEKTDITNQHSST